MDSRTQEIYAVVVTENEYVRDAGTNLIVSTKKRVIYQDLTMPAFNSSNAHTKAILAAGKIEGPRGIKDEDEVEVQVRRPFPDQS